MCKCLMFLSALYLLSAVCPMRSDALSSGILSGTLSLPLSLLVSRCSRVLIRFQEPSSSRWTEAPVGHMSCFFKSLSPNTYIAPDHWTRCLTRFGVECCYSARWV